MERWERERARVGRLGPERVVLTSVHARGASRPRGDVHETAFAAAVEALPRRRLCRARTPQRRFEFGRTQGVRGPRGRGRHGTTEREGGRATTQTLSANRLIDPFAAGGLLKQSAGASSAHGDGPGRFQPTGWQHCRVRGLRLDCPVGRRLY